MYRVCQKAWLRVGLLLFVAGIAAGSEPQGFVVSSPAPAWSGAGDGEALENLRFIGDLLRTGFDVYWISDVPIAISEVEVTGIRRGDFLVPLDQPDLPFLHTMFNSIPADRCIAVTGNFSFDVYQLRRTKVLLDAQPWTDNYNWYYDTLLAGQFEFEHVYDFAVTALDPERHNLFIAPGGGGRIPAAYNRMLRGYVAAGGNFIGSCWGAAQALYPSKVSYGSGNGAGLADAHNHEVVRSFGALGGIGHVVLRNDAPEHPIMWDLPAEIHNVYWNGPVMRPGPHATGLASFAGVVADDFQFHSNDPAQRRLDVDEERGKLLYLTSRRPGEGSVTLFGDHPEASDSINPFRAHPMGAKAVYNAVLYSTAGPRERLVLRKPKGGSPGPSTRTATLVEPDPESLASIRQKGQALRETVAKLMGDGDDRLTEDDPAGFFLLRADDALEKIEQQSEGIKLLAIEDDPRSDALRQRLETWITRTQTSVDRLQTTLSTLNPRRMNRRDAGWQPIVGPVFERSLELTLLVRDLGYQGADARDLRRD